MFICMYRYIHMYIHTYLLTFTIYMCIISNTCTCMHMYIYTYVYPPKDGLIALWPSTNGRVFTF